MVYMNSGLPAVCEYCTEKFPFSKLNIYDQELCCSKPVPCSDGEIYKPIYHMLCDVCYIYIKDHKSLREESGVDRTYECSICESAKGDKMKFVCMQAPHKHTRVNLSVIINEFYKNRQNMKQPVYDKCDLCNIDKFSCKTLHGRLPCRNCLNTGTKEHTLCLECFRDVKEERRNVESLHN